MAFFPADYADPVALTAFWAGVAALAFAAMLLLFIPFRWLWLALKQRRRQRMLNRWRPLLMAGLYEMPASLPRLSRFDVPDFLELWNHLHQSLWPEARDSLCQVAGRLRLPATLSRMLRGKHPLQAVVLTAGNLRLAAAWDEIRVLLANESPDLSLAAAMSLVKIDAERALPLLMPHIAGRDDWAPQQVEAVLCEVGEAHAAESMSRAIVAANPEKAGRLLRYLAAISPATAAPLIGALLADAQDEGLLVVCLKLVNSASGLDAVRVLTRYPVWHVRVHAATALGRIGSEEDEALLAGMLTDSQWWVRYRAARALSQLPWLDAAALLHIKDTRADRYARDMLHQVMVERELQAARAERHEG